MTDDGTSSRASDIRDTNKVVIEEYRRRAGNPPDAAMPLVLLTTTGRRSGRDHTTPVAVQPDGDALVVAGSQGGLPDHPQWYKNLVVNPVLRVEYEGQTYRARATVVPEGPERDRLFELMHKVIPRLDAYQERAKDSRLIPIVRLIPEADDSLIP